MLANAVEFVASIYLLKYQELPAQPGMVFSSKGYTVLFFNFSLETTFFARESQAHSVAFPKGGFPSSVGKYFSTSGNTIGKCSAAIICGIPSL